MNENWLRWIEASFTKYISEHCGDITFIQKGQEHPEGRTYLYFIIPENNFNRDGKGDWKCRLLASLLVQTAITESLYTHSETIGIASKCLAEGIPVYKLGPNDTDDGAFIGCLELRPTRGSDLETIDYGQSDPGIKVMQAVITGEYEISFE